MIFARMILVPTAGFSLKNTLYEYKKTFGTMIFLEEKELYFIYAEGLEAIIMSKILLSEKKDYT
jgi:hypothetical protein